VIADCLTAIEGRGVDHVFFRFTAPTADGGQLVDLQLEAIAQRRSLEPRHANLAAPDQRDDRLAPVLFLVVPFLAVAPVFLVAPAFLVAADHRHGTSGESLDEPRGVGGHVGHRVGRADTWKRGTPRG
jgi:hypothetical protein